MGRLTDIVASCVVAAGIAASGFYAGYEYKTYENTVASSESVDIVSSIKKKGVIESIDAILCGRELDPREVADYALMLGEAGTQEFMDQFYGSMDPSLAADLIVNSFENLPYQNKVFAIEHIIYNVKQETPDIIKHTKEYQ
jgi:hypothetical protein